jgi:predicted nucleic acid-binding protein
VAVALDADAIVGFLDRSDALHESAVKLIGEAAAEDSLVASAVTFAELLTGAFLGHHDEQIVRGFFADPITSVIPADAEVAEAAAMLRSRSRLRMPDALVLATAIARPEITAMITGDDRIAEAAPADVELRLLVD